MMLLALILIPLLLLALFLFFRTTPESGNTRKTTQFNSAAVIIGAIGCIIISSYSYLTTGTSIDSAWWPVLAFFGSISVFIVVLLLGGLYRNFIHFRE